MPSPTSLLLRFANITIQVSADDTTSNLLKKNYSGLLTKPGTLSKQLSYQTAYDSEKNRFRIEGPDAEILELENASDFIYFFEKSITIHSQKQRPDLFFLHSAALQLGDKTILIMGQSGAGKSTTTYALTHHGFAYLSDELSPIDLNTMMVSPYPHALCLKTIPPAAYALPEETLNTERTMHIPVEYLQGGVQDSASPVSHVFFVQYNPEQKDVRIDPVSKASASVQLYTNGLNHLCHENAGLPAATKIATSCDCHSLEFSDVTQACKDIKTLIQGNLSGAGERN